MPSRRPASHSSPPPSPPSPPSTPSGRADAQSPAPSGPPGGSPAPAAQAPATPKRTGTDDRVLLPVDILPQPDDETCGPTCLHAVLRYWGDAATLAAVVASCRMLTGRGTLAVMLGIDALERGYAATLRTFNLHVFDPTWFDADGTAPAARLADRLRAQAGAKRDHGRRLATATEAYLEFLDRGGAIEFRDLSAAAIARLLRAGRPVLTGLSATYLYRCPREWGPNDDEDDVRGEPAGHFVVLHGWDPAHRRVTIADPLEDNPAGTGTRYEVPVSRLIAAIMLGVLTHDANLLVVHPREGDR